MHVRNGNCSEKRCYEFVVYTHIVWLVTPPLPPLSLCVVSNRELRPFCWINVCCNEVWDVRSGSLILLKGVNLFWRATSSNGSAITSGAALLPIVAICWWCSACSAHTVCTLYVSFNVFTFQPLGLTFLGSTFTSGPSIVFSRSQCV